VGPFVVDASLLASDVLQTVVFLALLPLLWLFLFLFAWEDPTTAATAGFPRKIFWLLLPGALLGELTYIPFVGWNGNVLTLDVGGGFIPLALSALLVGRLFGDRDRLLATFLAAYAAECGLIFAGLLVPLSGAVFLLWLIALAIVPLAVLLLWSRRVDPAARATLVNVARLLGVSGFALVFTYYTTASVPGYGIVSTFPWYILAPVAIGALVVLLAEPLFGVSREAALGLGYAGTTFGVLIGADLLREPPLYASSGQLFSIGGAGVGDLLYLSGLLALAAGYVTLRLLRFRETPPLPVPTPTPVPPNAGALLRTGLRLAIAGQAAGSIALAAEAVRAAAAQTRRLFDLPTQVPAGAPLAGLPAPAWMAADGANLEALARAGSSDRRDATRAWLTARWLVRFAREVGRQRFGSFRARAGAFAIDLTLWTSPMLLVWYLVVAGTPGSNTVAAVSSLAINAVTFAYVAAAFLYFVLAEGFYGTTVGKWIYGLEVRDTDLGRPGFVSLLLRSLPKLIPLTVLGLVGANLVAFLVLGNPYSVGAGGTAALLDEGASLLVLLAIAILGVGLPAAASALCMLASPENQRLGDWFAGTWVVRRRTIGAPRPWAPVAVPAPSG
jgi:uncharacterized membrane protein/uncharacterized RDD family membrane protein YckC